MTSAIAPLLTILVAPPVILTILDYLTPIYVPPSSPKNIVCTEDILFSNMEAGLLPAWIQVKVEGISTPV